MLLTIIVFFAVMVAAVLLIRSMLFSFKYLGEWIRNSRPSVFPRPNRCPRCEREITRFDRMRSFRNIVLGGWSCPGCGSEFDQLDYIQIARAWNAHLHDFEKRDRKKELENSKSDDRTPVQRLLDE